jgi:hypothetical protein
MSAVHVTQEVGANDLVVQLDRCFAKLSHDADSRIVHPDVDPPPKLVGCNLCECAHSLHIGDVGRNSNRPRPDLLALLGDFAQDLLPAGRQHQVRPFLGEGIRRPPPDPAGGAGENDGRALKVSSGHAGSCSSNRSFPRVGTIRGN